MFIKQGRIGTDFGDNAIEFVAFRKVRLNVRQPPLQSQEFTGPRVLATHERSNKRRTGVGTNCSSKICFCMQQDLKNVSNVRELALLHASAFALTWQSFNWQKQWFWQNVRGLRDTFAISGFLTGIRTHIFASLVSLLDRPAIEPLLMHIENFSLLALLYSNAESA